MRKVENMSERISRSGKNGSTLVKALTLVAVFALVTLPCSSLAGDAELSDEYAMHLDPSAIKKVGMANYKGLMNYFHRAERAIESENLEDLMALYSDRYTNRDQDKKYAQEVWRKIFAEFDGVSAKHVIELLTYDESDGEPVAVLECSGLLQGTPKGGGRPVTIDRWDKQWHVLINEGTWRLFGNSGKSKKRYGSDDQVTHPLF